MTACGPAVGRLNDHVHVAADGINKFGQVRVPRQRAWKEIGLLERYDAENEAQAREWARRFCARWRWAAPDMVHQVLAFLAFPAPWRHRLRTTNLGAGWFRRLRRYLSRFPGCRNAEHGEQVLGCFCWPPNRCIAKEFP